MKNNGIWTHDEIQFPRLIAEIIATQELDLAALAKSMDLSIGDVNDLLQRAEERWETIKSQMLNKESPESKLWDIWAEGYSVTGESSGATLLASNVEAKTFTEAVETWLKTVTSHNPYITKQNDGTYTYWGCRLFDNERDARKSFG